MHVRTHLCFACEGFLSAGKGDTSVRLEKPAIFTLHCSLCHSRLRRSDSPDAPAYVSRAYPVWCIWGVSPHAPRRAHGRNRRRCRGLTTKVRARPLFACRPQSFQYTQPHLGSQIRVRVPEDVGDLLPFDFIAGDGELDDFVVGIAYNCLSKFHTPFSLDPTVSAQRHQLRQGQESGAFRDRLLRRLLQSLR